MAPRAEDDCAQGGGGREPGGARIPPLKAGDQGSPGLQESPPVRNWLWRPSTGLPEWQRGPGGATARWRLANSAPGAGAKASVPANAPPHPPPPAAAAAAPAAGAGNVQRSSAWFYFTSAGAPADPLFVHPQRAQVPRSSRPRGGQAAAACGPRVPSPQHAEGTVVGLPGQSPTLLRLAPAPVLFAFTVLGQFHFVIHKALGLGALGPLSPVPSAGRRGRGAEQWRRPRQLGTAPVSALLLARRAGGCAAVQPELGSPSPRPRVLPLPAPCPPRARALAPRAAAAATQTGGRADRGASGTPKLCSPLIDPLGVRDDSPSLPACHPRPRPRPAHWARRRPARARWVPGLATGCSRR